ncbi:hypothetical protein GBP346_B0948 [Burkholderia pseudomallei MSHR346]|nr:hypothetical protein BUC_5860 [Burkholderia pseudomallei 576]EEP51981.1 hypothetical protein GBP346_B0948 [Burkholderia pseudomallei MSHR346]
MVNLSDFSKKTWICASVSGAKKYFSIPKYIRTLLIDSEAP